MGDGGTERQGGCACGRLRFRARGEPVRVGVCHCLDCRKVSGSAFTFFAIFPGGAVSVEGERRAWSATGHGERFFCPTCGSHVWSAEPGDPGIEIGVGAFDEPNSFRPTYEAFAPRRERWLGDLRLRSYDGNRTGPGETEPPSEVDSSV